MSDFDQEEETDFIEDVDDAEESNSQVPQVLSKAMQPLTETCQAQKPEAPSMLVIR